jgi:hypothetical protein
MTDQKLRDLERRWKETGAPDDEAAYLLERVRVGDLTRERLELAAYCGHEGARAGAGEGAPPHDFVQWIEGFSRWGANAMSLVAVAIALPMLRVFEEDTGEGRLRRAIDAAREYVRHPSAEAARDVEEAGHESLLGLDAEPAWSARAKRAYQAIQHATTAVWVEACGREDDDATQDLRQCAEQAQGVVSPADLRRDISVELSRSLLLDT